jgi:hypothetical protein
MRMELLACQVDLIPTSRLPEKAASGMLLACLQVVADQLMADIVSCQLSAAN